MQSVEAVGGRRSASPPSSGRSSPASRATRRTAEDGLFKADKVLRRYGANIERALATWEVSPEEWADYIAFLGRLLKAIQTHPKDVPVLPHSAAISSKLAQCLNPALPSGVHQKALEVYAYIFTTLGNDHIASHLHDYLPGLSAVLSFASLSVRPGLYTLYEDHIVPLPKSELRPVLKSLILSLFPALEEDSSEDFERALRILQSLELRFTSLEGSGREQDGYFWQCLFLAVVTSPLRRQGALNYLSRRLPVIAEPSPTEPPSGNENGNAKLSSAAETIVSPEPGLLIRCFVCGLSDSQMLIQRGFLDLLVTNLPLSSTVLQDRSGKADLDRLVTAAMQVVLRKDMSLNRRLWSWFLGPEPKDSTGDGSKSPEQGRKGSDGPDPNSQLRYFSRYGMASLERCILKLLNNKSTSAGAKALPFRICLSLMDRWEIGGLLVPQIFLPAMQSIYDYSLNASHASTAEVVRSASLFFDGVEASLIWESLLDSLRASFEQNESQKDAVRLTKWIIETLNVKDEEMLTVHLPNLALYLLSVLGSVEASQPLQNMQRDALELSAKLIELVQAKAFQDRGTPSDARPVPRNVRSLNSNESVKAVVDFYKSHEQSTARTISPFSPPDMAMLIQYNVVQIMMRSLNLTDAASYSHSTDVFLMMLSKAPDSLPPSMPSLYEVLLKSFVNNKHGGQAAPFLILDHTVSLIHALAQTDSVQIHFNEAHLADLEQALTAQAWEYLSPASPKYHVEAVKLLWQLESLDTSSDIFLASLSSLSRPEGTHRTQSRLQSDAARKFSILWNHSIVSGGSKPAGTSSSRRTSSIATHSDGMQAVRQEQALQKPLFLILDCLNDRDGQDFETVASWLHQLSSLEAVFQILFQQLNGIVTSDGLRPSPDSYHAQRYRDGQIRELHYIFGHFQNILTHGSPWTWQVLKSMQVKLFEKNEKSSGLVVLTQSCVRFLCSDIHDSRDLNLRLIDLLELILTVPASTSVKHLDLDSTILDRLLGCISSDASPLQGRLLRLASHAMRLRLTNISAEEPRPSSSLGRKPSPLPHMSPITSTSTTSLAPTSSAQFVKCLKAGFSSTSSRAYLDYWLAFLTSVLPSYGEVIFANLLPLVECLCTELNRAHEELVGLSLTDRDTSTVAPETCIMSLVDALEMILDRSYDLLLKETDAEPAAKTSEPAHNFLSSVTSSVFKTEGPPVKPTKTNSKLTVILAFQDAIRVGLKIWLWATRPSERAGFDSTSAATTAYSSIRVRNRTRHLLEQIYTVEPLESLEVVMSYWCTATDDADAAAGLNLLHVMQVTKPKHVVPAILDAICSRTNPSFLAPSHLSSQTQDLTASETATFYAAYLDSTEDDAIDEIWQECITFCRDVLANPLPHRLILPHLLSIIQLLAQKLNNTNFGEQRRMRRDLGDIFQRMLIASFTTLPSGYISEPASNDTTNGSDVTRKTKLERSMSLITVLNRVTAQLDLILETVERTSMAVNNISAHLVSPLFHAKSFPKNVSVEVLTLVASMGQKAPNTKYWKKEIADAFNDAKFLASPPSLVTDGWFPALHLWTVHDKERMPELLSRLAPPTSAGIMFGVGATAARLEADRKTQLNLRRICFLLLASPKDTHVAHLRATEEKIVELFEASTSSSPSTAIKSELFLLWRTLAACVSSTNLAPMWPIINDKLQLVLNSILPSSTNGGDFNNLSLLQACKLLGTLITLSPDEFQLHQWLYITDTIDAVYKSSDWNPYSLSDQIAEALGSEGMDDSLEITTPVTPSIARHRRMLLNEDLSIDKDDVKALPREDFVRSVLRPYLSQLSIHSYESVYGIDSPDLEVLREDLLADLLDVNTIVE